jgi:uncharacterized protein YodC (DUF2158 family)
VKVGDVVRLKSGGPLMTVRSVEPGGALFCICYDAERQRFDEILLPRDAVTLVPDRAELHSGNCTGFTAGEPFDRDRCNCAPTFIPRQQ